MKNRILAAFVCMLMSALAAAQTSTPNSTIGTTAPLPNKDRVLKVMTRNMDTGSDFGFVTSATTPFGTIVGVTETLQEVLQSNIPERAQGIAAEIQAQQPDFGRPARSHQVARRAVWRPGYDCSGRPTPIVNGRALGAWVALCSDRHPTKRGCGSTSFRPIAQPVRCASQPILT